MAGAGPVVLAKRALVVLLRALALAYNVKLEVNRDSSDADIKAAVRKVAGKAHPDKGGSTADAQKLFAARDAWLQAAVQRRQRGRPKQKGTTGQPGAAGQPSTPAQALAAVHSVSEKGYRIQSAAVLLTYQGFPPSAVDYWERLQQLIERNFKHWRIMHWCATMETNDDGGSHFHVMLQFRGPVNWTTARFIFESRRPNASINDYLGEGPCKKKPQESTNRGMFYVYANKVGTQRKADGELCVAGNYFPAWTTGKFKYEVKARWAESLWRRRKLSHATWEEYLYLCRDNVLGRKKNLDAVLEREQEVAENKLIKETAKRLRENRDIYQPFPDAPAAQAWLALFGKDALRYPILVVRGPSHSGKTEWVKSLFDNPLEVKIGLCAHFPDGMRKFDRALHDGLILDDLRDLKWVTNHQHALQGKYDARIEFAITPGGTCAYTKWLYKVPTVVTCNFTTDNLGLLETDDWLGREKNRVVLDFPDVLEADAGVEL